VQLLGRVGQYPKKGKADVWRFSLATNTTYQSKDEFGGTGVCTTEYHGTTEYQSYLFLI
jgi:hypothetical protein